ILYPLAEYSPEWIALTAGLRAKKLVRFMDLPAETFLALHEDAPVAEPAAPPPAAGSPDITPEDEDAREKKLSASSETVAYMHDPARVVVVCGAFHSTALDWSLPAMTDAEAKKLPRVETSLTLMPYSYYRLSSQSGYGAGNHAPGYFQKVWEEASTGNFRRLPT